MDFKNINDLNIYLQKIIDQSLADQVAKTVKDEIQMSVSETVYNAYDPRVYNRRGGSSNGGMGNPLGTGSLADQEEMISEVSGGVLRVVDVAGFNENYGHENDSIDMGKSLAYNIEYGYGDKTAPYKAPRPFIQKATEEMKETKSHVNALAEGLSKRGVQVKGWILT